MTSPLDKKKSAEETKYSRTADFEFKAISRRNKLLGLWAAEILGLSKIESEEFARQTVLSDFEEPGDEDVLRKIFGDLKKASSEITEVDIRNKMDELLDTAKSQIESEAKD
ncbi:MAG: hypothetical protein CFH01_01820 [Alphaproteobacteria bacterium MarineAlpha2_Bin1]|nr:MAG: hypothetical protein CFH01_01820 [Alphaproteobacteria bacterium MarineAlpha2_Bin1]